MIKVNESLMCVDYSESFRSQLKGKVKYTNDLSYGSKRELLFHFGVKGVTPMYALLCKPRCNNKV